jgi:hypothetical protein
MSLTSAPATPGHQSGTPDIDPAHSDVPPVVPRMVVSRVRGRFAPLEGTIVSGRGAHRQHGPGEEAAWAALGSYLCPPFEALQADASITANDNPVPAACYGPDPCGS